MKYLVLIILSMMLSSCSRVDNFGEGVTHEVITGTYEGRGGVRQEVYRRQLFPIKVQAFYDDGSVMGQTYYMPIDSLMLISTRTYYPTGVLKSINLRQSPIDTFTYMSIEGKVTKSIRFYRDYSINILEFYPNGKIKMRYGRNNFDSARVLERWYDTGIKQSEEVDKYAFAVPLKSIEWDSLGHRLPETKR